MAAGDAHDALIVYVTAPLDRADSIADSIVGERLAACANVLPAVRSVYWWEGEVQRDDEALLLLKTTADRLDALVEHVRSVHPYENPEVIAAPIVGGAAAYLAWIGESVGAG